MWTAPSHIPAVSPSAETESLVWPPAISDGAIVWFVNEPVPNAEAPDRSRRSLSFAQLLSPRVGLKWYEAVAIVQQITEQVVEKKTRPPLGGVPSLTEIQLLPSGRVLVDLDRSGEPFVTGLGKLLAQLLLAADFVPTNCRHLTDRVARSESSVQLDQFIEQLADCEIPGRPTTLAELHARAWRASHLEAAFGAANDGEYAGSGDRPTPGEHPESVGASGTPASIDVQLFQSGSDVWGLEALPHPLLADAQTVRYEPVEACAAAAASAAVAPPFREHNEILEAPAAGAVEETIIEFAPASDTPRRHGPSSNYRPWVMAAAVSSVVALGGTWTREQKPQAVQSMAIADLVKPTYRARPDRVISRPDGPPLASSVTASERTTMSPPHRHGADRIPAASRPAEKRVVRPPVDHTREAAVSASLLRSVETAASRPSIVATFAPSPGTAPPAANGSSVTANPSTPLPATSASTLSFEPSYRSGPSGLEPTIVTPKPPIDDQLLVQQALQRYRVAYDELDAPSARAVWPSVNQAALARAFGAIASQTLSFETCDIQVQTNQVATATCRGVAQYVPKIGNRDPHTESRVWNFSLRKEGSDWMIDRALVAR